MEPKPREARIKLLQNYVPVRELAELITKLQAVWIPARPQNLIFGNVDSAHFPPNTGLFEEWKKLSDTIMAPICNGFDFVDRARLHHISLSSFLQRLGDASYKNAGFFHFYRMLEIEAKRDFQTLEILFFNAMSQYQK